MTVYMSDFDPMTVHKSRIVTGTCNHFFTVYRKYRVYDEKKELFSSKVVNETDPKGSVEGVPAGGPRERKESTSSTGNIKSKWVKAFKTIKGKDTDKSSKNGGPAAGGNPAQIIENSHVFQEYTYKKITPCDVCSQILRGHTRQGLKCKLCRMNVHPDCQEKVVKCQPKSKLLRRQKSASEFDARTQDHEDESGISLRGSVEPISTSRRELNLQKSLSTDSGGQSANHLTIHEGPDSMEPSPTRRRMGGSYGTYTAGHAGAMIALQTDGELVDSSGRRIKPSNYNENNMMEGIADQPRYP